MKSIIILFLGFLFVNCTFSQENLLKIINTNTGKELIIKENKRIKIKTCDNQKISGKFKILDNHSIIIKGKQIELNQIAKIKRAPLLITIITNGFFYYSGIVTTGISLVLYVFTQQPLCFLLTIPAAGMIYGGSKSPNVLKGYKKSNLWTYEIIMFSE